MKRLMKKFCFIYSTAALVIGFWLGLLGLMMAHLINTEILSQVSSISEFGFNFLLAFLSTNIYRKSKSHNKSIIFWLLFGNIFLFINDIVFYGIVYFQSNYSINLSFVNFLIDIVPYSIWVIAFITFLSKLLMTRPFTKQGFAKIFSVFLIANFLILYLFLSSIDYAFGVLTWQTLSQVISSLGELIIFDLAITCLVYSESIALSFLLAGFVFLISGDFIINYSFLAQTERIESYGELFWFLGIITIFLGLLFLNSHSKIDLQACLRKTNSIKSRLAFWAFGISVISILPFFVLSYLFSDIGKSVFLILPPFIMINAVAVVVISVLTGGNFEKPFKKIASNIENLILNNKKNKMDENFSIDEFIFLQKFITHAHEIKEDRDRTQKELGEIAAQVAHDIRSPLAALNICLKMLPQIPEEQRVLMRNAANRINDIANNLLLQHKGKTPDLDNPINTWLLSPLIETLVSEKRMALGNKNLSIESEITNPGFFAFSKFDANEMKRLLSNLINNSVEAMDIHEEGVIKLSLDLIHNKIHLSVSDNGSGISPEVQEKILTKTLSSTKEKGHGLGLSHAKKTIETLGGSFRLISSLGHGTQILMTWPNVTPPSWFISNIEVSPSNPIAILDDDNSVHGAWDNRLNEVSKNLEIHHFYNASDFMTWHEKQLRPDVQVFSDYELLGDSLTGLEVLEKLDLNQPPVLVTSHYENKEIIERCQKSGIKLLPKNLLTHASIVLF